MERNDNTLTLGQYADMLAIRMPHGTLLGPAYSTALEALDRLHTSVRRYCYCTDRWRNPPTAEQEVRLKAALYVAAQKAAVLWQPWLVVSNATSATYDALRELGHALRDVLRLIDRYDLLPPGELRNKVIAALGGKVEG